MSYITPFLTAKSEIVDQLLKVDRRAVDILFLTQDPGVTEAVRDIVKVLENCTDSLTTLKPPEDPRTEQMEKILREVRDYCEVLVLLGREDKASLMLKDKIRKVLLS